MTRRGAAALALALLAGAGGCAGRGAPSQDPTSREMFGVYRASLVRSSEEKHFRLLLFAALPDRLHAEVMPPVGSASVILDAGGGRISVLSARDRVAYVGSSSDETLRKAIGLDTTVEALVRAVMTGDPAGGGVEIEREPPTGPGLPRRLALRSGGSALTLTLESMRKARAGSALGAGAPPAGVEIRPLDELPVLDGEAER